MISYFRGLFPALLGLVLFGVVGCGENNEDFIKAQQAANAGKAKAPDPNAPPPPRDQNEYGKQQQQQQKAAYSKSSGYPGAK